MMAKLPTKSKTKSPAKRNGNGTAVQRAPGESQRYLLGQSNIFKPEVINDIHIKSDLGRYRMRGFSMFKKIPHWDDLTFLPGTLTRFVIEGYREKCDTKHDHRPARQAAAGARHSDLRHRHELRRPVL
jgi:methylamine---glutamate N-methyltransferase subunit C